MLKLLSELEHLRETDFVIPIASLPQLFLLLLRSEVRQKPSVFVLDLRRIESISVMESKMIESKNVLTIFPLATNELSSYLP